MTYWEGQGKYQDQVTLLGKKIPFMGYCTEPGLEFLRVVRNAYYDCYNNGACNESRFRELLDQVDCGEDIIQTYVGKHLKTYEVTKLREWIEYACKSDRETYLFGNFPNEDCKILALLEKLLDAAIGVALKEQYGEDQKELVTILNEFSSREGSYYDKDPVYIDDLIDRVDALETKVGGIDALRIICPESHKEPFDRYIRRDK